MRTSITDISKSISSEILENIDPNLIRKHSKFSESAKHFIFEMYVKIHRAYMKSSSAKIINIQSFKNPDIEGIPEPIRQIIHSVDSNSTKSFQMQVNSRTLRFHFWNNESLSLSIHHEYIRRMSTWIFVADEYASSTCSQIMDIFLYFTDHCKILPTKSGIGTIDRVHVNTAFTYSCRTSNTITIFRKEEWFKVFIHETFHSLGLDFSGMHTESMRSTEMIRRIFHIGVDDLRIYESYTETFAELLHTQFVSFYSTILKTDYHLMFSKMQKMVAVETAFSLIQCMKVLRHNRITEYPDLFTATKKKRELYLEKTHVISYFVIKSIMLFHKNEFLEWYIRNNPRTSGTGSGTTKNLNLDFEKTTRNVEKYAELIISLYKTPAFLDAIRLYGHFSSRVPAFQNCLRMTVYEMK
jgi:hypothetical protein